MMTEPVPTPASKAEQLRRWRLILGGDGADGTGCTLEALDADMDKTLEALYDQDKRNVGFCVSAPRVARWLGDIRTYFPSKVVQVMQKDAFEHLGLKQMLLQPEMLAAVEPDVHLVATLLSLNRVMPEKTKETARQVIRKVVAELEKRLDTPLRQAVSGSLSRSVRNRRPRHNEIDWNRTIRANLRHYQPDLQTIIPENRIGHGRKGQALKEIILCIDQSGSMATSVVYASIMGAVLASIKSVKTSVVVYDTAVVDLSDLLSDPVEVLFGTQLGGGNDTTKALLYCQGLIRNPVETILVLISDLYEGALANAMIERAAKITASGVQMITLLALDDRGAPSYDHEVAAQFAYLNIPCFACTPDLFPEMMANAIKKQDLNAWAATQGITTARAK